MYTSSPRDVLVLFQTVINTVVSFLSNSELPWKQHPHQLFRIVRYAVLFDEFRLSSLARCGRLRLNFEFQSDWCWIYCNIMAWNQTHRSDSPLRLQLTLCASFTVYYHLITLRLQITNWLQGLFIFAMVWSIGGTINGDSRKKFDAFFRLLISGTDKDHPKPNNIKMTKVENCC